MEGFASSSTFCLETGSHAPADVRLEVDSRGVATASEERDDGRGGLGSAHESADSQMAADRRQAAHARTAADTSEASGRGEAAKAHEAAVAREATVARNEVDVREVSDVSEEMDASLSRVLRKGNAAEATVAYRASGARRVTYADAPESADAREAEDVVFELPKSPPPDTPRTPRHQRPPPAFCRTLSLDPSVFGSRRSSGSAVSLARGQAPPLYEDTPAEYEQSLRAPSVWLKFMQFIMAVVCLSLLSDGYMLEVGPNITAMTFPFIVFSSNTIITGVILFSYVMGMKMRELLIRIFGTMGGLLFLISGIHTLHRTVVFWENWEGMYVEGSTLENPEFDMNTVPRRRVCFVAQVALSFVASAVYLGDVVFSYRRTMKMLQ